VSSKKTPESDAKPKTRFSRRGFLGGIGIGAAGTGLLAVALRIALPSVPAEGAARLSTLVDTFRRRGIGLGIVGHVLVVLGHFLAYTYIRVALERVHDGDAPINAGTIILLLALFGIGGFIGNIGIGVIVDRSYRILAVVTPFVIAAMVLLMNAFTGSLWAIGVVVFVWGFFFASWLLIANTWIGHRMPDRLEAGGSLVVMGFQAAIMTAAALGGALVDGIGITQVYVIGAAVLVVGAVLFGLSDRLSRR